MIAHVSRIFLLIFFVFNTSVYAQEPSAQQPVLKLGQYTRQLATVLKAGCKYIPSRTLLGIGLCGIGLWKYYDWQSYRWAQRSAESRHTYQQACASKQTVKNAAENYQASLELQIFYERRFNQISPYILQPSKILTALGSVVYCIKHLLPAN
jgi:hypothetical protein